MALSFVTGQLPGLIEKYEPMIESNLVTALTKLKTEHPDQSKIFLDNWRKLNKVVEKVLAPPSAGRKRTIKRKQRKY